MITITPVFVYRDNTNTWMLTDETFTRSEAAQKLGISRTTLWRYESRIVKPANILDYYRYVKAHPKHLDWYCIWILYRAIEHFKGEGSEPESGEEIVSKQEPAVEESAIPSAQPDTPVTEDVENVPVEANAVDFVTALSVSSPQSSLEAIAFAALDHLGKREARKLMGGLKLQQKRNGVELSTELMIASIRREFKVSPERVIEVMSSRLPGLLPNVTARQEQLASLKSKGRPAA